MNYSKLEKILDCLNFQKISYTTFSVYCLENIELNSWYEVMIDYHNNYDPFHISIPVSKNEGIGFFYKTEKELIFKINEIFIHELRKIKIKNILKQKQIFKI